MAFTIKQMALIVSLFTILSFFFGFAASVKKGLYGDPRMVYDSTSATLVYLSVAFLLASSVAGFLSLVYPYKGMSVPSKVLFNDMSIGLVVLFPVFSTALSAVLLLIPTIVEHEISHQVHNNSSVVANNISYFNYYRSNRLFVGACLSFDSGILWLATLLFVHMVREDYFRGDDNNNNYYLINGVEKAI